MEYYFENNKELNKFSMVFDITSFLWLEEHELMHEREKILNSSKRWSYVSYIYIAPHLFRAEKWLFLKKPCAWSCHSAC